MSPDLLAEPRTTVQYRVRYQLCLPGHRVTGVTEDRDQALEAAATAIELGGTDVEVQSCTVTTTPWKAEASR